MKNLLMILFGMAAGAALCYGVVTDVIPVDAAQDYLVDQVCDNNKKFSLRRSG